MGGKIWKKYDGTKQKNKESIKQIFLWVSKKYVDLSSIRAVLNIYDWKILKPKNSGTFANYNISLMICNVSFYFKYIISNELI